MILDELISELERIKRRMGGHLPVVATLKAVRRIYLTDEDGEGYEETTTEDATMDISVVTDEMFPPTRGDSKRKVVIR